MRAQRVAVTAEDTWTPWLKTEHAAVLASGSFTATWRVQVKSPEDDDADAVDMAMPDGTVAFTDPGHLNVSVGGNMLVRAGVASGDFGSGTLTLNVRAGSNGGWHSSV